LSIEIRDSDGGLGNIIIGRETIKDREFVDAMKEHLTQDEEKFKKYKYSLSDYTATFEFDVSNDSIYLIAEYCDIVSIVNPDGIVAIVANKDLIYGLARMWDTLSYRTNWEKKVFRNREDAESWIKERVKEKFRINDLTFD